MDAYLTCGTSVYEGTSLGVTLRRCLPKDPGGFQSVGTVSTAECLGSLPTLCVRSYLSPGKKSVLSIYIYFNLRTQPEYIWLQYKPCLQTVVTEHMHFPPQLSYGQPRVCSPAGHAALGALAATSKAPVVSSRFSLLPLGGARERAQATLPSRVGHIEEAVTGYTEETQMEKSCLSSPAGTREDTVTSEALRKDCLRRFTFKMGWRVNGE